MDPIAQQSRRHFDLCDLRSQTIQSEKGNSMIIQIIVTNVAQEREDDSTSR